MDSSLMEIKSKDERYYVQNPSASKLLQKDVIIALPKQLNAELQWFKERDISMQV